MSGECPPIIGEGRNDAVAGKRDEAVGLPDQLREAEADDDGADGFAAIEDGHGNLELLLAAGFVDLGLGGGRKSFGEGEAAAEEEPGKEKKGAGFHGGSGDQTD